MIDLPRERDPLELLADEFASRYRKGETPSVSEYAAKYPQLADQIEELFPTVAMMEQLRTTEQAKRHAAFKRVGPARAPDRVGDFRIIREVGRGGMGIVYEAQQQSLGRRVAVKVLPNHVLLLDSHLKRFQREARTAARLHHTNVVPVFGVGEQEGLHYYVMPLIRGVGLDELLSELRKADQVDNAGPSAPRADRSFPGVNEIVRLLIAEKFAATSEPDPDSVQETGPVVRAECTNRWRTLARIGLQAACALDYAHAQGTLHRDVKPSNLLIDENALVCVADFGLARAVDQSDVSRSGEVVGTLRYMAPEQLNGTADARSDVYSLGLTLYELLTLRPAFQDTDRGDCLSGRRTDPDPTPPKKINRAIPRDLETIVLKALAREPSKRYQTAAAMAEDLRRFLEDKPIRARRVSRLERAWRWCRRNPALAAVSALAAVLLFAVGATALTAHLQTRKAYAGTKEALTRSETTSQLALDVLDDIYLQLSPDRIWIISDANGGAEACACLGLRSSAGSSAERAAMQMQASEETALLLEGLLVFYDRLAEQAGDDAQVMLQSAIAGRRVGDIRQRLGQLDEAQSEYIKAIEKLTALKGRHNGNAELYVELARCHNELGNVRSVRLERESAHQSHRKALSILQSFQHSDQSASEYRYELARTFYLMANKHVIQLPDRRGNEPRDTTGAATPRYSSRECREAAVGVLEQLAEENPHIPDYRFLLALCHRPCDSEANWDTTSAGVRAWRQAIQILEELTGQYPEVVDYRYELTTTYAWANVGLFPWQSPSAASARFEPSLLLALNQSQWLVDHNPTIPHYARCKTLILAKLGTIYRNTQRLAEAERFFQQAFQTQSDVITRFPELPSHNQILLEFIRLRQAQASYQRNVDSYEPSAIDKSRNLLETCVENLSRLTSEPELADDRLAWSSLPAAYKTLSQVFTHADQPDKAEEAKQQAEAIPRTKPHGRRQYW